MRRKEAFYAVIGGIFGAVLVGVGCELIDEEKVAGVTSVEPRAGSRVENSSSSGERIHTSVVQFDKEPEWVRVAPRSGLLSVKDWVLEGSELTIWFTCRDFPVAEEVAIRLEWGSGGTGVESLRDSMVITYRCGRENWD